MFTVEGSYVPGHSANSLEALDKHCRDTDLPPILCGGEASPATSAVLFRFLPLPLGLRLSSFPSPPSWFLPYPEFTPSNREHTRGSLIEKTFFVRCAARDRCRSTGHRAKRKLR
jgi:hypothetical protein